MRSKLKTRSPALYKTLPLLIAAIGLYGCSTTDGRSQWHSLETLAKDEAKYGNSSAAEKLYLRAIKKADELQNAELTVNSLLNLSDLYIRSGNYEKADATLTRVRTIGERQLKLVVAKSNEASLWRTLTARSALGLANIYRDQGKYLPSKSLYQQAIDLIEANVHSDTEGSTTTSEGGKPTTKEPSALRGSSNISDTNSARDTNTTGDTTGSVSITLNANQLLLAEVKKDRDLMIEYRRSNNEAFDQAIRQETPAISPDRDKIKKEFEKSAEKFYAIATTFASESKEIKVRDRLALAKSLFGIREPRYRRVLNVAFAYFLFNHEFDKARALLNDDIKEFSTAENITLEVLNQDPEKVGDSRLLSFGLFGLGEMLTLEGKPYSSIPYRVRSIALRDKWGPNYIDLVTMRRALSTTYEATHNYSAAITELDKALSLYEKLQNEEQLELHDDSSLYNIFVSMANLEKIGGSYQQAYLHLNKARDAAKMISDKQAAPLLANWYSLSADLAGVRGNHKAQKTLIEEEIDFASKHQFADGMASIQTYMHAARYYIVSHEYVKAAKFLQMAMNLNKKNPNADAREVLLGDIYANLATLNLCIGNNGESQKFLREYKKTVDGFRLRSISSKTQAVFLDASCQRRIGKIAEADRLYEIAENLSRNIPSETPDLRWNILANQAVNKVIQSNFDTARSISQEALALAKQNEFRFDLVASSLSISAWIELMEGNVSSSQALLKEAKTILNFSVQAHHHIDAEILLKEAQIAFLQKNDARAQKKLEESRIAHQKAGTNFDNLLFEWHLDRCLGSGHRPPSTSAITREQIVQYGNDLRNSDTFFRQACSLFFGSALLKWNGRDQLSQTLMQIACDARDSALTKHPLR
jgi:tetratricopeptide (TPR) repeat protein